MPHSPCAAHWLIARTGLNSSSGAPVAEGEGSTFPSAGLLPGSVEHIPAIPSRKLFIPVKSYNLPTTTGH